MVPTQRDSATDGMRTTDAVVLRIEQLIKEQYLVPGNRLPPERALATELSVSRNMLREAMKVLTQKGLLRVVPGHGAYITVPSSQIVTDSLALLLQLRHVSLTELCDARLLIEPELAALAAEHATAEDIAAIQRCIDRLFDSRFDAQAHVDADLAFHESIARAARHSVYQSVVEAIRSLVTRSMQLGTSIPRAIDASDGHHRAIFHAIALHDIEAARAAMWGHMAYIQNYIRRLEKASSTGQVTDIVDNPAQPTLQTVKEDY